MCLHMQSQAHLEPLGPDLVHARCQAASRQALGVIQVLHRQGLLCWRKDGAEPGPCQRVLVGGLRLKDLHGP